MPPIDPADLEYLRAGAFLLSGLHRLLLPVARRLEGDPAREDGDAPAGATGAAERLAADLRCIVQDRVAPAAEALAALAAEAVALSGGET